MAIHDISLHSLDNQHLSAYLKNLATELQESLEKIDSLEKEIRSSK